MIRKLSALNFKSWEKTGEIRLAPITGLFGSNSSGKTSILQLFLMLKQTAESADRTQVLHLGDKASLVELGTFRDVLLNHAEASTLKFEMEWDLTRKLAVDDPEQKGKTLFSGDSLSFGAEIDENGSGRMSVKKLSYMFAGQDFGMLRQTREKFELFPERKASKETFGFVRTPGRVWPLPAPIKCYGFPDQVKAYYQNAAFLADLELAFENQFSRVYYLGPLREYPKREYTWAGAQPADMGRKGEKVVDALLASREGNNKISRGKGIKRFTVEEYVAYWLKELKLIHSFSVEQIKEGSNLYQVWVKTSPMSARVLITDVGFGVSQILPVLTLCYYVPEGSTLLMEQPEIHLHPSVQAGLADVFIDAIKTRKIQIILESHSEHLLKRLQRRIAEEKLPVSDSALYFCKMHDGRSVLKHLDVSMFGEILNWPENFFGDDFAEISAIQKAKLERLTRDSTQ